jgi:hypothetical protein
VLSIERMHGMSIDNGLAARGGLDAERGGGEPAPDSPISNKGGNVVSIGDDGELVCIEVSLDWLTYTGSYDLGPDMIIPPGMEINYDKPLPNLKGYNTCHELLIDKKPAGRVAWHTEHHKHKICVQLSGQDLDQLQLNALDHRKLIAHAIGSAFNITRLDLALDIHGAGNPTDLYNAYMDGKIGGYIEKGDLWTSSRRTVKKDPITGEIERNPDGTPIYEIKAENTAYIGSTKSDHFLRCYDKAAEQGLENQHWTRVELVTKQTNALVIASAILQYGIEDTTKQALRDYIQPEGIDWWEWATTSAPATIAKVGRKKTNTEKWLETQVLPCAQRLIEQGSRTATNLFYNTLLRLPIKKQEAMLHAFTQEYRRQIWEQEQHTRRILGSRGQLAPEWAMT